MRERAEAAMQGAPTDSSMTMTFFPFSCFVHPRRRRLNSSSGRCSEQGLLSICVGGAWRNPPLPLQAPHGTAAAASSPATPFILPKQRSVNMASTAGVKYVSIFLHPPCFWAFYIRIHRQILFSVSNSKQSRCRLGKISQQLLLNG